jgi:hypothetical protein
MKYTLIAFKPEEPYWDYGDKRVHPADLIREESLTKDEIINRISQLAKNPNDSDCAYDQFHIFEYIEYNEPQVSEFSEILSEGLSTASKLNKEAIDKQNEKWKKEKETRDKKEYERLKSLFEK